ncbi:MAG: penicillin-binding protein 1C [Mariprofundaceae bacterium]|nr:penicillin-binding protein 1C [Mariprofundaceae bacterium]
MKIFIKITLIFLLLMVFFAFWTRLETPLFSKPLSSLLLSREGELLGAKIASDEQWRFPPQKSVPLKFQKAITCFEDKRFFSHNGVDPLATMRALWLNLSQGHVVSGGSTLSMQVIRLSRHNPARTYVEKLHEMLMAMRLEWSYSKQDILALYASHAPFGGNVVGLETAAWRYFHRGSEKLSWAESCLLAVLPNSPALIHPGRNRDVLKKKRDRLLKQLLQAGVLSDLDYQLAMLEALPEKPHAMPRAAPHFFETLMKQDPNKAFFKSTLDVKMQAQLTSLVRHHAKQLELQSIANVAAIVIDHQTFEVMAYAGNNDTHYSLIEGAALDLIRRPRSTGSILKPLLFSIMLQEGELLPDMLVKDVPTHYAGYKPQNYDRQYRGAVPARDVIRYSLNIPSVRMLHRYGLGRFYNVLENMGMTTLHRPPQQYGLSLILGGAETTLWDMAGIYANLAKITATNAAKESMTYQKLKVLQHQNTQTDRHVDVGSAAAWLTLDALLAVNRPDGEGDWKQFDSAQKIAWKTGTSYGLRDAWAIGNSSRYTVAVWAGNASGEGRSGLVGVKVAAPIMFDVFSALKSEAWFAQPLEHMKAVQVCVDDGYLANDQCESRSQLIPTASHFSELSPYHHWLHLDQSGRWQVNEQCESVSRMQHVSWFNLPPSQAFFYRQQHASYQDLPPFRQDCVASTHESSPLEIVYPSLATKIYIPIDLDGKRSKTVFKAVHRDSDALLYWHLDGHYLAQTQGFHQQALLIGAGQHRLTIVDAQGYSRSRSFEVLSKE